MISNISPGLVALVGQSPSVDQFRWIAWFGISLAMFTALLLAVFFHEEKNSCSTPSAKSRSLKKVKLDTKKV